MSQPPQDLSLHVIARAPFHLYFDGEAAAVSASNKVGNFDILPGHADFFSLLSPGDIVIDGGGEPLSFSISNGIMTVRDNEVMIFVNI